MTGEVANWPDVALEADVPTAAESGGQPGEFTFYCPNDDATGEITVYFLVSGTFPGADYSMSGAEFAGYGPGGMEFSVELSPGSQSATVEITLNDTGAVSGSEAVTLTMVGQTGYNLGYNVDSDENTATVTIFNNDLPTVNISAAAAPTPSQWASMCRGRAVGCSLYDRRHGCGRGRLPVDFR